MPIYIEHRLLANTNKRHAGRLTTRPMSGRPRLTPHVAGLKRFSWALHLLGRLAPDHCLFENSGGPTRTLAGGLR